MINMNMNIKMHNMNQIYMQISQLMAQAMININQIMTNMNQLMTNMNQMNQLINSIKKLGNNCLFNNAYFTIKCTYIYYYNIRYGDITFALNKSEVTRIERLAESTILFDKTGYITKTQERCRELNHYFWFYLVDYIPPIDQDVAKEFKKLL